jgi:hypothetical protein
MAPVCETRQIKLENVLQWLVLHNINDYLLYTRALMKVIIDEVNDCNKRLYFMLLLNKYK